MDELIRKNLHLWWIFQFNICNLFDCPEYILVECPVGLVSSIDLQRCRFPNSPTAKLGLQFCSFLSNVQWALNGQLVELDNASMTAPSHNDRSIALPHIKRRLELMSDRACEAYVSSHVLRRLMVSLIE